MCTGTGLKRSMPCDDLISLRDAGFSNLQAEANRFLEESSRTILQQSRNKRQCLGFDSVTDKSPATAALEAALMMDDAIGFDTTPYESDLVQISFLSTWASDAVLFSHDYYTCTKQMHKGSIPSVNTVENVAGILSKLTTAPTAA
eukprot:scaffold2744_cov160-Amphora_coffeaeformis.AAC.2